MGRLSSSLPLEFCYENFGCCDQERDKSIAAKYRDIMDYMDPQGHKLCGTYIRDKYYVRLLVQELDSVHTYLTEIKNIFKGVNEVTTSEEV